MPAADFKTVGEDLLHVAADVEQHFDNQGYDIFIEQADISFPFTPTLVCTRGHETVIVEVSSHLDKKRLERWIKYSKSQSSDTRVMTVLRGDVTQEIIDYAQDHRLGLCSHDDQSLAEIKGAGDLALQLELPDLSEFKRSLRAILSPIYKKITDGDWRDGLNNSYNEVEQLAREYLIEGMNSDRVKIQKSERQGTYYSAEEVEKMTLGALGKAFNSVLVQNHKDSRILATISLINEARIGITHKRKSAAVEADLRKRAGQHMYAIINCLEELIA